jgi:hypothetical protein
LLAAICEAEGAARILEALVLRLAFIFEVLGRSMSGSFDSRRWGTMPSADLMGR